MPRSLVFKYAILGMLGFASACIAHEAIGHGVTCLATGGRVMLVTAVYGRCEPSSTVVDAMGVVGNLAFAALAWLALAKLPLSQSARHLAAFIAAFNAMWGGGYLLYSAILNIGDWAVVLRDVQASPAWLWRVVLGAVGVMLYSRTMRMLAPQLPSKTPLLVAYLSAGALAVISVAVARTEFFPALIQALDESLLAAVGLVYIAFKYRRTAVGDAADASVMPAWLPLSALPIIIGFLLIQGRGIGAG